MHNLWGQNEDSNGYALYVIGNIPLPLNFHFELQITKLYMCYSKFEVDFSL